MPHVTIGREHTTSTRGRGRGREPRVGAHDLLLSARTARMDGQDELNLSPLWWDPRAGKGEGGGVNLPNSIAFPQSVGLTQPLHFRGDKCQLSVVPPPPPSACCGCVTRARTEACCVSIWHLVWSSDSFGSQDGSPPLKMAANEDGRRRKTQKKSYSTALPISFPSWNYPDDSSSLIGPARARAVNDVDWTVTS